MAGGEGLHDAISRVAAKKPVVAVMSGRRLPPATWWRCRPNGSSLAMATLTGSIGVLMQTGEVSGLLGKLGISRGNHHLRPAEGPAEFHQADVAAGREVLQGLVTDMYDQFVAMVAAGRNMPAEQVRPNWPMGVPTPDVRRSNLASSTRSAANRGARLACQQDGVSGRSAGGGCQHRWPGRPRTGVELGRMVDGLWKSTDFPKSYALTAHGLSGNVPRTELRLRSLAMTKSELIAEIAEATRICAAPMWKSSSERSSSRSPAPCRDGERVELRGFGAFTIKHRNARTGRNPRTGEAVAVDEKAVPFFKAGKELRERVNRSKPQKMAAVRKRA